MKAVLLLALASLAAALPILADTAAPPPAPAPSIAPPPRTLDPLEQVVRNKATLSESEAVAVAVKSGKIKFPSPECDFAKAELRAGKIYWHLDFRRKGAPVSSMDNDLSLTVDDETKRVWVDLRL